MSKRFLAVLAIAVSLAAPRAFAACGQTYSVNPIPPSFYNWTDPTVWTPAGYPGTVSTDCATDNQNAFHYLTINTAITLDSFNFNCSGCVIDIQPGGSLTVASPSTLSGGAALNMAGGTLVLNSTLTVGSGSYIIVHDGSITGTGGTINLQAGSTMELANSTPSSISANVNNSGSFQVDGGGANTISGVFNNVAGASDGTSITNGQLTLSGGGTGGAPFFIALDGTLDFPSSYTMTTGGTVSGAGLLQVRGGTLTIGGVTTPGAFRITAGTLDGGGFLSILNSFYWEGGTIEGTGGTELAGTGIGYVSGAGPAILHDREFNNYGRIEYAPTNPLQILGSASLIVYGYLNLNNDTAIGGNGTLKVSPNGVMQKNATYGTTTIFPYFVNNSDVGVFTGTLELRGTGTHDGLFLVDFGTTLEVNSSQGFNGASLVVGDGTVDFVGGTSTLQGGYYFDGTTRIGNGATVNVDEQAWSDTLTFDGGALSVSEDFNVVSSGTWSKGTLTAVDAQLNILSDATFTIDAAYGNTTINNGEIQNDGTIFYTAQAPNFLELENNSVITNYGVFDIQTDQKISSASVFDVDAIKKRASTEKISFAFNFFTNNGTLKKSQGAGIMIFEPTLEQNGDFLAQSGTIAVVDGYDQASGRTALQGGNVSGDTITLNGGVLEGTGTITGTVKNGAEVSPGGAGSTGNITITGNYVHVAPSAQPTATPFATTPPNGKLTIELASGSYDQLNVQGNATLDGILDVSLLGGYQPPNGATFDVLTATGGVSGDFAQKNLPTYGAHGSIVESVTPTTVRLTAVVTPDVTNLSAGMTGPATANAGGSLSYIVTITNNGTDATSGTTTVVDTLPAGVSGASGLGTGWSCLPPSGGTITCTSTSTIASGSSYPSITFTMTAPANGTSISNSATVSSPNDSDGSNNTASVPTTVVSVADLGITKSGAAGVIAGQNVVYTVTVQNYGPSTASNVVISDPTPTNLTFVSNAGGCTNPYPCNYTTLTSGQTVTITSTYSTAPSFSGNVTNTASVSSSTNEPSSDPHANTANASTNVGAQADLLIVKSGPASATTGQNIVYNVVVTNNGPSPATFTTVSDPTPVGIAFQSNSGACTTAYPCDLGTLAAGQSATIVSTYTVPGNYTGTSVTNTASVSSSNVNDPNTGNNASSVTTNIAQQADVGVSKTGPVSVAKGQNIVYTITVTNSGPAAAGSVQVQDVTPSGVTFVSNTGACTTAFPCSLGTINASQTATITSTYNVPLGYTGTQVVNQASVTSGASDNNSGNNQSTATTAVTSQADLGITKSGPPSAGPGANITYTIVVTNGGPNDANTVTVTDPTPSGLTFVSNSGACTSAFPCNLGTMTNGQTATITSTYNVPANFSGSSVSNTASVSSSTTDQNANNNAASVSTSIVTQADLSIVKSGPATASVGQNVVYTITVTNIGPLQATNVFVTDPTPSGLTFVSNTGACTTSFPCALGTLAANQTATITTTFNVPANYVPASINNTASVSGSSFDANNSNNSSTATTAIAAQTADISIMKSGPFSVQPNSTIDFVIDVVNNGPGTAANVVVSDPTPVGLSFVSNSGACTTAFPCSLGSRPVGLLARITSRYTVNLQAGATITNTATVTTSSNDALPGNNTSTVNVPVQNEPSCPSQAAQLIAPAINATVPSPVQFSWSPAPEASEYTVIVVGAAQPVNIVTTGTTATAALPAGSYTWAVQASFAGNCPQVNSAFVPFKVCTTLTAPVVSVIGESTSGQTYSVQFPAVEGSLGYELQEASSSSFTNPNVFSMNATSRSFLKNPSVATAFFYRARALGCGGSFGPFSEPISVVVVPPPVVKDAFSNISVPAGSTTPVTFQLFIPGLAAGPTSFVATPDKPWLSVIPTAGIIPPEGITFTVSADPSTLVNGTTTGTIIVVFGNPLVGTSAGVEVSQTTSVPISITLVTPVTPAPLSSAANSSLVIPTIGHLAGASSNWRSDIRVANVSAASQKYLLTFNPGAANTTSVKQTTINVDSGATTALDDIVRNWFGNGSLGDSASGSLTIQQLDAKGQPVAANSTTTVVSSRTYNAASAGTLGQYVPAIPFPNFITRIGGANPAALGLQQIAQSAAYRTNLGIVEAAGKPASVLVDVIDASGKILLSVPVNLLAGENKQLNGFLLANGISSLDNGRIQVQVTSGDGRVTAYASVVDNQTNDPFLVSGATLGALGSSRFVIPGVADLNSNFASWRSDVRVLNAGPSPLNAIVTFYPNGDPSGAVSRVIFVDGGEVKALDNILQSLFTKSNVGGTVHVTTPNASPLVVTARTYAQSSNGTLGQFISAVTPNDAVGAGGRALQIVQLEESSRYRTNIGIAEVTGKPATLELTVVLPDSKVSPKLQVPLAAFESRQLSILGSLGLGNTYNARISVRVIEGDGKVTAYGSVIDMTTQAPTYIPAQ